MSDIDDYSSETDDSYDDSYDESYDEEENMIGAEWNEFFSSFRQSNNDSSLGTPKKEFKPTTPLLESESETEPEISSNEFEDSKQTVPKEETLNKKEDTKEIVEKDIKEDTEDDVYLDSKENSKEDIKVEAKEGVKKENKNTNDDTKLDVKTKSTDSEEKEDLEDNQKNKGDAKENINTTAKSDLNENSEESKEENEKKPEIKESLPTITVDDISDSSDNKKPKSVGKLEKSQKKRNMKTSLKDDLSDTESPKTKIKHKRKPSKSESKTTKQAPDSQNTNTDPDSESTKKKRRKRKLTVDANEVLSVPEEISSEQREIETLSVVPSVSVENNENNKKRGSLFLKRLKLTKKEKISKQDQKKAATKIQALWRGYSSRKHFHKTSVSVSVSLKQLISLRNILAVERKYVSNLDIIIESYLRPLIEFNKYNEEARKALPIQVIKAIFRNIESIYNLHAIQLKYLENTISKWPFVNDIPAQFLKATASFSIYSKYAKEAAAAEETLRFYKQKQPLCSFLTKMYDERVKVAELPPNTRIPGLYTLLTIPYKHLGKLYHAYSEFMCATPSFYTDYELLADSVAILSQLKSYIWETAEVQISKRKMMILSKKIESANSNTTTNVTKPRIIDLNPKKPLTVENLNNNNNNSNNDTNNGNKKIKRVRSKKTSSSSSSKRKTSKKRKKTSKKKQDDNNNNDNNNNNNNEIISNLNVNNNVFHFDLYTPNRKLIRSGSLLVGAQKRHVFLFNDVCLVLEVIASNTSRFETVFDLCESEIHSKTVSLGDNTQTFRVKSNTGDFIFTEKLNTEEGELSWMQSFEELITLSNDKIFGTSLETIVKRENSAIPSVVLNIIQYLNKNITDTKLFQSTYNSKSVQNLRDPSAHRKLNNSEISDVVGLLILYLEQLPDIIIEYNANDNIFTAQSTPDEETLLEWVRIQLKNMKISSKNLLEYLMSFLSKVLARSTLNNVASIDISVIFSPLIIRPKELSLGYCSRMARIIRIVKIMIERAGDLFKTVDNDSYPLPLSLIEFFKADQFGQWWRDFRQKKQYFIKYIAKKEIISELVTYILNFPDSEDNINQKENVQFASLSYGVLVNDGVINSMFKNNQLLCEVIKEFNGQNISERANKHFCDFIEVLLRSNPEAMSNFLINNENMNSKIISSIGSGNFCNMILSVAETWHMIEYVHKIVVNWGILSLNQFLILEDKFNSDLLANTVRFLRFLVRTNNFIISSISKPFVSIINDEEYIGKMIKKSLFSNPDTCVCTIPLIIEILVQNKNKNPCKSTLDNIVLNPPDSPKLSIHEKNEYIEKSKEAYRLLQEQLKDEVPSILLILLEFHKDLINELKKPLNNSENNNIPLGFFRFGIVKLVQAILVTNYPYGNSFVAKTDLVCVCLDLFFHYYKHSILHSVIAYIVRYIMAMGNRDLVEMLLITYDLPGKIINLFEDNSSSEKLEYLRGYLKMLSIAIGNSNLADLLLENNKKWHKFLNNVILCEDTLNTSSNNIQVTLAQKKIARTNLTKTEFTDQLEDKIG